MLLPAHITPLKFPFSPPSSTLSPPLTPCQGSPPDSDDFCAACKGAGEFVCCDGCPRVFHYLCCDPPRIEPPDGSFLCYECNSKVKHVDDSPVEAFAILGPLFTRLENTNARSFALPKDVQVFFDNVTPRDDGSFYEEIKKFTL